MGQLKQAWVQRKIFGSVTPPSEHRRWSSAPNGVGIGGVTSLPDQEVWGTIVSSQAGSRAAARNTFWHILQATERFFLPLYANDLSSSTSVQCLH